MPKQIRGGGSGGRRRGGSREWFEGLDANGESQVREGLKEALTFGVDLLVVHGKPRRGWGDRPHLLQTRL